MADHINMDALNSFNVSSLGDFPSPPGYHDPTGEISTTPRYDKDIPQYLDANHIDLGARNKIFAEYLYKLIKDYLDEVHRSQSGQFKHTFVCKLPAQDEPYRFNNKSLYERRFISLLVVQIMAMKLEKAGYSVTIKGHVKFN